MNYLQTIQTIPSADASTSAPRPTPLAPDPGRREVVEGLLGKGELLWMRGAPYGGKTFAQCELATSVALGIPFSGLPCTKGRVLYINLGMRERDFEHRLALAAMCTADSEGSAGLPGPGGAEGGGIQVGAVTMALEAAGLDVWNLAELGTGRAMSGGRRLRSQVIEDAVEWAIGSRGGWDLVVIDPVCGLTDGTFGSVSYLEEVLPCIRRLADGTGAAVSFSMTDPLDLGVYGRPELGLLRMQDPPEEIASAVESAVGAVVRVRPIDGGRGGFGLRPQRIAPSPASPAPQAVAPAGAPARVPAPAPSVPLCPKCGKPMVVRPARRGWNAGNDFYGCPDYPKCNGSRPIGGRRA